MILLASCRYSREMFLLSHVQESHQGPSHDSYRLRAVTITKTSTFMSPFVIQVRLDGADANTWIITSVTMITPLIYNERQLHFALTRFFHNRDELDHRSRNDGPLGRSGHATYLADKSELRVLLRNRCLRSTIAASIAGKTGLVRNLWEAVYQRNVQRFEEELLYQRHNSRPRRPDAVDWLEYHAGIDVTVPQTAQIVAPFESPEMVRAAPIPDPFGAPVPGNLTRQQTPPLPLAVATPPAPPILTGVPGLHLIFPPSATRNPQDQPDQDRHVIPGLDLLADANRGPSMYAIPPPDRPLTPRWFVRVRDRLRNARHEHHGNVHFQAVLERLRRRAGHPQPEPAEQRQQVQPEPQPAEQVQPQS